jgi:hypothetical protein
MVHGFQTEALVGIKPAFYQRFRADDESEYEWWRSDNCVYPVFIPPILIPCYAFSHRIA